ncbi:hypothetical protein N0V93_007432 [Gnomoniopsis smithogilvyi]|uniref:Cytochrome P450 n=1 Tax=Gnomoniopsis smithogilvyi TaxID=1191159 RepID=A0A9W9CVN8_9PEZI|nr:hypothetical protein N0V93_007432 [Gnomoniopsis smithogilvyi]
MLLNSVSPTTWLVIPAVGALVYFFIPFLISKNPRAPGPFLARFTNLWQAFKYHEGHFEKINVDLHRKHGNIIRLGPSYYSLNDVEATKTIYGLGTKFMKGQWYESSAVPDPEIMEVNMFPMRDIKKHADARRRYASLYAMSSLVGYEPYINNCIAIFSDKLRDHAKERKRLDLSAWFQLYAFDVIGEITFSKRFGFLETGKDIGGIMHSIGAALDIMHVAGLFKLLILIQPYLGNFSKDNTFSKFVSDQLEAAKKRQGSLDAEDRTAPDFLSKLLSMPEQAKKKDSDSVISTMALQNVFAGSDTTSISLTGVYFQIVTRPEVLAKLRAEVDAAYAAGELSDPPTYAESLKLPYLQAVIKEGLRLHPATGLPLWRQVPEGGATLCGTYFPAGTNVGVNSWVMHHNPSVYGDDADEFRAERWIDSPKDKLRTMNDMFMTFGLGSRTCIGKNISLLEISKLIPHMVRRFDINLDNAEAKCGRLPSRTAWFVKQKDFHVTIKERSDF